jgi:DNA mismatch repair protein MSH6
MDNPSVENTFTTLAKSLPDLERIVSRIHAGSCKPKDFHRVLTVRKVALCV